jgi:hypothetical protein
LVMLSTVFLNLIYFPHFLFVCFENLNNLAELFNYVADSFI